LYLRRKGYDNEQAKDLTQGFFQEVVLGRKLIQQADKTKGRFRTFLLHALNQYLRSVHRKQTAKKRIPENKIVPWELIDAANLLEPVSQLTPEESFNYAWLCTLLDRVLAEVESECLARGMKVHWQVFHDRVLQPIRQNNSAPSLSKICDRYNIGSAAKASNMIITVNRRFQAVLRRYLRRSVASDTDVTSELWELMDFFPKNRAG